MEYEITNLPGVVEFVPASESEKRIVANAKNLLMTRRGEIPYDRLRGFDTALYDLPMQELRERLPAELDRVMLWEPAAEVRRCSAEKTADGTLIRCVIDVRV